MPKPGVEGERRLLTAVAMLVRRKVEERLPIHMRGIHAPILDQGALRSEVKTVLSNLVNSLAEEVAEQAGTDYPKSAGHEPEVPGDYTNRLSVLDNKRPCADCGTVRVVAILDYQQGHLASVQCERCAPEFNGA